MWARRLGSSSHKQTLGAGPKGLAAIGAAALKPEPMDFNQDDAFSEEDVDTIVSPPPPPAPAMAQWTPGLGYRARSSRAHLFSV